MGAVSVTNSEMPVARLAFRVTEAAALIGVSAAFLRLELARGNLTATRLGRRVVLTRVELDRYLGSRQSPSNASTVRSAASEQLNPDAAISSAKLRRASGRKRKPNLEPAGRATANGKER
jgi:excisionase family DNA binding protein